MMYKSNTNIRL